jgi:signal transduction histidine kinase
VDKLKTEIALTNTLNNAIKFTPNRGQIMVTVLAKPREAWIKIQDTGAGLASDQLEKIFDQFYQVEEHLTRKAGGMGLGLSIARGVLEAQGGRIWAESAGPEQGSAFIIALPLAA